MVVGGARVPGEVSGEGSEHCPMLALNVERLSDSIAVLRSPAEGYIAGRLRPHSLTKLAFTNSDKDSFQIMARTALLFLVVALVALSFAPQVAAFGAGKCSASHATDVSCS